MSRDIMTESLRRITGWGSATGSTRSASSYCASRGSTSLSRSGATPYRRRRPTPAANCCAWVFLALLVVPIVEIAAIIAVGRLGDQQTLPLLVVIGTGCVDRQARGAGTWLAAGGAAGAGCRAVLVADAALVLSGGTAAPPPGFVTDIVGFFFILPLTRPVTRAWLEALVARRLLGPLGSVARSRPADSPPRPQRRTSSRARSSRAASWTRTSPTHARRCRAPPAGTPGIRWVVSGGLALARPLAAGLAQERQALLEELLELGDRAALEQHVPVGAHVLDGLGLRLRAPALELGLRAAPALPCTGRRRTSTEKRLDRVPVRAQVVVMLRSLGTTFSSVSMLSAPSRLPHGSCVLPWESPESVVSRSKGRPDRV